MFFGDDLLRLWLESIQYDLQHDFAWVTDEAYCSVVLALLQVAFLGHLPNNDIFSMTFNIIKFLLPRVRSYTVLQFW